MNVESLPIPGAFVITMTPRGDERGWFARAFCREVFEAHGLNADFVQANASVTTQRGTIRGLHFQHAPHAEDKLIRCIRGALFDVMVDLRPDSPTYHQWHGVSLQAGDNRMVYVPKGCAHGFQSLADDTEVFYPVTHPYTPGAEGGLRWDDPALNIVWPIRDNVIVSEKDRAWPLHAPAYRPGHRTG